MKKILPLMVAALVALPAAAQTLETDDGASGETSISSLPAEEPAAQPAEEPAAEPVVQRAAEPVEQPQAAEAQKSEPAANGNATFHGITFARPGDIYLKFGLNLLSLVGDDDEDYDMDFFSPVVFLDKYFYPHKKFGLGFGIGFMYVTTHDEDFGWIKMNSYDYDMSHEFIMPLYGTFKLVFSESETKLVYSKFDIGYSWWWEAGAAAYPYDYPVDEGYTYGGLYIGAGLGIDFKNGFNLEAALSHLDGGIFTRYRYSGYWRSYEDELSLTFIHVTVGHAL